MKKTFHEDQDFGAVFSECRKHRYALWRVWDRSKPLVMFIGLNPSTANESDPDPTIRSVGRISKHNGFGGFYMMNCFAHVSTDPTQLPATMNTSENDEYLKLVGRWCHEIVFAWGSFNVVGFMGRDMELTRMFPQAKCLHINKDGSPKHPLFCKSKTSFIKWKYE